MYDSGELGPAFNHSAHPLPVAAGSLTSSTQHALSHFLLRMVLENSKSFYILSARMNRSIETI